MSCKELIDSLRDIRDDKIAAIWDEAKGEADRIKGGAAQKAEQLRTDLEKKKQAAPGEKSARALIEANNEARAKRLAAERDLSQRLSDLAAASLPGLRNAGYPEVFDALAWELPPLPWTTVRVNPEDVAAAKENFPGAKIVPEKAISGGLDAETENGMIRVVNTFEKRLERAWAEVLPVMIREIYGDLSIK